MITPGQNRFYWSLWSKAKKQLMHGRETFTGDEENKRRHELHRRALGYDKSHKDFTNRELDAVLAQFKSIIDPFGAAKDDRQTVHEARRRRLYFGLRGLMRKLKIGEEYVQAIADRMFFKIPVDKLAPDELQKLMIALKKHEQRSAA